MRYTHEALSRGLGLGSIGCTERHQLWAKDSQGSPNSKVIQQPTFLEDSRRQSEASAKPEAEMGQREAGRPSSYNRQAKPTANRLQEKIRAIVRKAVDTWWHPQAGRLRGGRPAPHGSPSSWGLAWKLSTTVLPAFNRRYLQ